jgi:hypothetical protein
LEIISPTMEKNESQKLEDHISIVVSRKSYPPPKTLKYPGCNFCHTPSESYFLLISFNLFQFSFP